MKHLIYIAGACLMMAACQTENKQKEAQDTTPDANTAERMAYTVPATSFSPAMEAEYYSGPTNAQNLPDGEKGYIRFKDGTSYWGEFRDGFPVAQLKADSIMQVFASDPKFEATASGMLYHVVKSGHGTSPKATDEVSFNYEGRFTDNIVFDSNYGKEPMTCSASNLVKGFTEALTMMTPGSEWEIVIPYHLAYGVEDKGPIPAYSPLIFKITLVK